MQFKDLLLAEPVVRAVAREGYSQATPIQAQSIPPVLAGRDVLGCAQTGTGKTGAFALPIIHQLVNRPKPVVNDGPPQRRNTRQRSRSRSTAPTGRPSQPRALVLCPTRELATQITDRFKAYSRFLPMRTLAVFGGVSKGNQVRKLQRDVDIVVATPGRLLDLLNDKAIDLRGIEILVLDEADRMLDMGFIHDIRRIMTHVPKRRQTLLFSATMPKEIRSLADTLLNDPVSVQVDPVASAAVAIEQSGYIVHRQDKPDLLIRLLNEHAVTRPLVFTRTKYGADKLVKRLRRVGIDAAAIHGDKTQSARTRALEAFRNGDVPVLVATDIAARGIDVQKITHVINYDLPEVPETYVHRIGRTARAGASGIAISFCDPEQKSLLRAIERLTETPIETTRFKADRPREDREAKPKPSKPRAKTTPKRNKSAKAAKTSNSRGKKKTGRRRRGGPSSEPRAKRPHARTTRRRSASA
ncbi:MAG: DEAD/DEAH box helicase [Planctomycetota bacterium]